MRRADDQTIRDRIPIVGSLTFDERVLPQATQRRTFVSNILI